MFNDMKRFTYIRYYWDLLHLYFTNVKSVKISIKKTKDVKDIKISQILRKTFICKLF